MKHKIIQLPDEWNGILIVGEAPGKEEQDSVRYNEKYDAYIGKPFIGKEGQYLRNCCKAVSFPFSNCIVTNTVHQQPKSNKYDTLSAESLEEGKKELIADIKKFNPKLIIAIGGKSLQTLTGQTSITKYRGSVIPCSLVEGYKVFATIHPGFIFKGQPQYDAVLKMDLKKALDEVFPEIIIPERNVNVIYDVTEALETLYNLCYFQQHTAVDIETAGSRLLAFGVATSPKEAIVIPKELLKYSQVLKAVSEFCNSNVKKIYHNALYDVFYLAYYYKIFTRNIAYDTMLAQHAIFPTLPKSLAFCSSIFTKEPYWKDEGKEVTKDYSPNKIIDWPGFYIYNGKDCCVTYEVFEKQQEELDFWKTREIFNLMMRAIDPALVSMLRGFAIDSNEQKKFADNNEKAIEILNRIKLKTIGDINLNSPKQTVDLLYNVWKLPPQRNKGKLSSADDKVQHLETFSTNVQPLIGIISKTREHLKLRSFYNINVDEDGRLRCSQKIHGTKSGRWATSKSITGSGMNMQNQAKAIRVLYKADSGKIFIQWDLANSEARIVAALCEDAEWLRSFDIEDQHNAVASSLFGIPKDQVRNIYSGDKTYRDYGKKIAHATNYLEGPMRLSRTLGCSFNEAKTHVANYKALHPSLVSWHKRVATEVGKSRVIRTVFGRVIQFFGPFFKQKLAEAVAIEPQSTSADYLTTGLLDCLEQIPELEFRLQVHDSALVQVDDDLNLLKAVIPKIKKIMEKTIVIRGLDFKIPVEFEIGYNWGKMKKIKNNIDEVYGIL